MREPGLLFDLDGVLINSGQYHWRAWKRLMEEGAPLSMDYESFLATFGKRNEEILAQVAPEGDHTELAKRKEELFRAEIDGEIELLDGVEEFLQEVDRRGLPRIIASSTPPENLHFFLTGTPLGRYFDQAISGSEVSHGKPAPDLFLAAAARIEIEPSHCIVFEDSPAGLQAGAAAGSFVVALATTHASDQLDPYDMVVPSLAQVDFDVMVERWEATIANPEQ